MCSVAGQKLESACKKILDVLLMHTMRQDSQIKSLELNIYFNLEERIELHNSAEMTNWTTGCGENPCCVAEGRAQLQNHPTKQIKPGATCNLQSPVIIEYSTCFCLQCKFYHPRWILPLTDLPGVWVVIRFLLAPFAPWLKDRRRMNLDRLERLSLFFVSSFCVGSYDSLAVHVFVEFWRFNQFTAMFLWRQN